MDESLAEVFAKRAERIGLAEVYYGSIPIREVDYIPADAPYNPRTCLPEVQWRRIGPPAKPVPWFRRLRWKLAAAIEAWNEA